MIQANVDDTLAAKNILIECMVDDIIKRIDKSTLLGAAYDCMSDSGKDKFRADIKDILSKK